MKIDGFIKRYNLIVNETNKRVENINNLINTSCKEDPSKVRLHQIDDDLNFIALNIIRSREVETEKKVFGKNFFTGTYDRYKVFDEDNQLKYRNFKNKSKFEIGFIEEGKHPELVEFLGKDFKQMLEKIHTLVREYKEAMDKDEIFRREEEKASSFSYNRYLNRKKKLHKTIFTEKLNELVFFKEDNYNKSSRLLIKKPIKGISIHLKEGNSNSNLDLKIDLDMEGKGYQSTEWMNYTIITNDVIYKVILKGIKQGDKIIKKCMKRRIKFEESISNLYKKHNFYKYLTLRGL